MKHDKLSDYEIAESFGHTLSGIYKDKINELNCDLNDVYEHTVSLMIPRYTDFEREFAELTMPTWAKQKSDAIDHINKIRQIYRNIKKMNDDCNDKLDYIKAREVSIESLYNFKRKGKNVSCPWHEDKHPSASIKFNRLICFQCGYKGSSIDFFMKLNNVTLKQAVQQLNKM